jgi:serpin B
VGVPAELALVESGNDFGFDLLAVLAPEHRGENLFFSPLSASMALGMTLNGAAANTFEEMRRMLGYGGLTQTEINDSYASLLTLLQELDPRVTVEIANSVWHRQGLTVDQGFTTRVRSSFDAEVAGVDFGAPTTLARINDWVEDRTNGTIDKLFDSLDPSTVMLLMNAVYFKGDWTDAFDPDDTRRGPFRRSDGTTVQADFMGQEMAAKLRTTDTFDLIELPYGGQAYAMTVVLPADGIDPGDLAGSLTAGEWASWVQGLGSTRVILELPRFEIEWERDLTEDLIALGMVDAFEPGAPDFTRMIPGGGVWVDLVKQKSFVRVDERGTEAAAVTGVVVVESLPATLRVDRPFLFAIRERLSGTVLFLGIVRDPS